MKKLVSLLTLTLFLLLPLVSGISCKLGSISSKFDTKLTGIEFRQNFNLFGGDTLYASGDRLAFDVDVIPKDSFTGEPFITNTLGNKDIGFSTFVESRPYVYLALFSRDGYYFGATGPLIWTPDELKLPDSSNRNYYIAQNAKDNRIKHIVVS